MCVTIYTKFTCKDIYEGTMYCKKGGRGKGPCKFLKRETIRLSASCIFCINSIDISNGLTSREQVLSLLKEGHTDAETTTAPEDTLPEEYELGVEGNDVDGSQGDKNGKQKLVVCLKVPKTIETDHGGPSLSPNALPILPKPKSTTTKQRTATPLQEDERPESSLAPQRRSASLESSIELERSTSTMPSEHGLPMNPVDFNSKKKAYREKKLEHLKKMIDLQEEMEMLKEYAEMKDADKKMQTALEETERLKRRIGLFEDDEGEGSARQSSNASKRARRDGTTERQSIERRGSR